METGHAGNEGVGVEVVVTFGAGERAPNTGTVTRNGSSPVGVTCRRTESVTSAGVAPSELVLVTCPVIAAGSVLPGEPVSATNGIFPKSVPEGTSKTVVGLYVVVTKDTAVVCAETTIL